MFFPFSSVWNEVSRESCRPSPFFLDTGFENTYANADAKRGRGSQMEIILRNGPGHLETQWVEEHTRTFTIDNKWVYSSAEVTDSEGRTIFMYNGAASEKNQRERQIRQTPLV
jgi:hypothetical protein